MRIKNTLYLALGWVCLGLGTAGILVPLLPTGPFYLATVFCFSRGSERLHRWFLASRMYQNFVVPFREKGGIPLRTKLTAMAAVTLLLGFGFWMMDAVPVGRAVVALIWLGHIYVIFFRVPTLSVKAVPAEEAE